MSRPVVPHVPVRPDLATVTPIHYPIVEHSKFGSVKAMCKRLGLEEGEVWRYIELASINRSEFVVLDRLVLGDPEDKKCAVLLMNLGGGVTLCAGLFVEASADRATVEAFCKSLAADKRMKGRFIAIGEFRPSPRNGGVQ